MPAIIYECWEAGTISFLELYSFLKGQMNKFELPMWLCWQMAGGEGM